MATTPTNSYEPDPHASGDGWDEGIDPFEPDRNVSPEDRRAAQEQEDLQGYRTHIRDYLGINPEFFLRSPEKALGRAGIPFHVTSKDGGWSEKITLPFKTAAEISKENLAATEYIVPGVLPKGSLTLLSGIAKGSGKTTFALAMASALINGTSFLGESAVQTPVVYLTEQSMSSLYSEYLAETGIGTSDDLHIVPGFEVAAMSWEEVARGAVQHAVNVEAQLVVVDTFMHFAGLRGEQENSSAAVQNALKPLQHAVAMHDLAVVVVHHDRKAGGSVYSSTRGSSAFQGVVDLILNLKRPTGGYHETVRELRYAGRFGDIPSRRRIKLCKEQSSITYKSQGSTSNSQRSNAKGAVLEHLSTEPNEPVSKANLKAALDADGMEVSKSTLGRALDEMTQNGVVKKLGEGKKGDPYKYRLSD